MMYFPLLNERAKEHQNPQNQRVDMAFPVLGHQIFLGQLKVKICQGRCSRGGGTRRGNWRLESGRCTNPGFGGNGVQGSEGHFFWKFEADAFNGLDLQFCVGKK